jgi:N-hydroxyarylamine O-acetyltransferase
MATQNVAGGTQSESTTVDTTAYLERMNYRGPLAPTAETLRQLQLAHLLSVPFENLSIHAGEPIVLDDEALFDKIVVRRRGGFCYELNGLFAALLRGLGFDVKMLSAGMMSKTGEFGPDFDHMTLLVSLADRWLVDVGFGDSFTEPLLLDERGEQVEGRHAYRITEDANRLTLMQRDDSGEWIAQYRFCLEPQTYADFAGMCRYHQTSPASHFTRRRICSRLTAAGRMTLTEMRLINTTGDESTERELISVEEYNEALREHFGVVV